MWRGETDIDKIHVDFSFRNLKVVEVVVFQLQTEFPQANWFTLNVTFSTYER